MFCVSLEFGVQAAREPLEPAHIFVAELDLQAQLPDLLVERGLDMFQLLRQPVKAHGSSWKHHRCVDGDSRATR